MAEQNVVIKIQADVSKATNDVKALQQVIAKLSTSGTQAAAGTERVSNAAKKTATAAQLLDKEIRRVIAGEANLDKIADLATRALEEQTQAQIRLAQVSGVVEDAVGKQGAAALGSTKQIGGLADASGAASFALLSLGQAFQDSAQFGMGFAQGFRAINNNIQQTFTALALGSVQAGGFDKLLKLMGGSLWGPGGLILGFSALSAGIEFFATRAQKAEKESKKLQDSLDGLFTTIKVGSTQATAEGIGLLVSILEESITTGDEWIQSLKDAGTFTGELARTSGDTAKAIDEANAPLVAYIESLKQNNKEELEAAKHRSRAIQGLGVNGLIGVLREGREELDRVNGILEEANMIYEAGFASREEFQSGLEAARQRMADFGLETELSAEKFAELIQEDGLEEYIRELRLDALGDKISDAVRGGLIKVGPLNFVEALGLEPKGPTATAIAQRFEEIQRSSTLVGRMQGAEGLLVSDLRTLTPEVELEMQSLAEVIDEQNRNINTSFKGWWNNNKDAVVMSAQLMQQSIGQIGSTFMQLAQTGDEQNKKLFETGKKFAIAQALISTYVGFTKALEQKGPLGFITGASVLAAGMAKVQAIRSTTMSGGGKGRQVSSPNVFAGVTSVGALPGGAASQLGLQPASQRSDMSVATLGGFGGGVQVELVAQGRNLVSVSSTETGASKRRSGLQTIGGGIIR